MHVFVYEWVTGGGLLCHPGPLPPLLLREGLAMAQAVAEDFARVTGCRVSLLRDLRVLDLAVDGADLRPVGSPAEHNDAFDALCRSADAVLLIAPELDGALASVVADAVAAGASLISPGGDFVAIASDKHRTARHLREAGVPAPDGVVLDVEDPLPGAFRYPAVCKPLLGAGSEGVCVVTGPADTPPPRLGPHRLEPFVAGVAASVAVLTGPGGSHALPPCTQRLSTDGRLRYLGGRYPLPPGQASRAERLALRAIDAMPATQGYVGVDLVLGANPDGSGDTVIEVNPRLTTSYAALRFIAGPNLAHAMQAVATGGDGGLQIATRPLEFAPDGAVSYLDPDHP
ncbi:MAG: ATP-grasp domain-containing protein [Planctomycetota bacterium]